MSPRRRRLLVRSTRILYLPILEASERNLFDLNSCSYTINYKQYIYIISKYNTCTDYVKSIFSQYTYYIDNTVARRPMRL